MKGEYPTFGNIEQGCVFCLATFHSWSMKHIKLKENKQWVWSCVPCYRNYLLGKKPIIQSWEKNGDGKSN